MTIPLLCECRGSGWVGRWQLRPDGFYQVRYRACWCQCRTGWSIQDANKRPVPVLPPGGKP